MTKYSIKKIFNMINNVYASAIVADISNFAVSGHNDMKEMLAIARRNILNEFHIFSLDVENVEFLFRAGNVWFNSKLKFSTDLVVYHRLNLLRDAGKVSIVLFKVETGEVNIYNKLNVYNMENIIKVMKRLNDEVGVNTFMIFALDDKNVLVAVYIYKFVEENGRYWLKDLSGNIKIEVEVK